MGEAAAVELVVGVLTTGEEDEEDLTKVTTVVGIEIGRVGTAAATLGVDRDEVELTAEGVGTDSASISTDEEVGTAAAAVDPSSPSVTVIVT